MDYLKRTFLGKEVNFFPGDTDAKFGIVRDIDPSGITFEITAKTSKRAHYHAGDIVFIAMQKLTMRLV